MFVPESWPQLKAAPEVSEPYPDLPCEDLNEVRAILTKIGSGNLHVSLRSDPLAFGVGPFSILWICDIYLNLQTREICHVFPGACSGVSRVILSNICGTNIGALK